MLYGATLFGVGDNTKIAVCSLISHGLIFACVFLSAVFPECRSCLGISPQRFVLFGTLMSWRYFAGEHIPFGRSCTFQAAISGDKYILAKKHDHSRISKRMEKALKKQEFPRLWTGCVIIKEIERWGGLA